jgi:hypothetical protein
MSWKVGDKVKANEAYYGENYGIGEVVDVDSTRFDAPMVRFPNGETYRYNNSANSLTLVEPAPVLHPVDDAVNHPSHYTHGNIEVIEAIEDWQLPYFLGNVVKYVARCDHKGNPVEDLRKAKFYLEREIAKREKVTK